MAGACAFDNRYKSKALVSEDRILKLAVSMSSSDHTLIQRMRTEILSSFGTANCACVVTQVLSQTLKHNPSLREIIRCASKECENKNPTELSRSYLTMEFAVFNGHMDNIERSIAANLNIISNCRSCQRSFAVETTRVFGDHLFIEVGFRVLLNSNENQTLLERRKFREDSQITQAKFR